jgi:hypothetical protein
VLGWVYILLLLLLLLSVCINNGISIKNDILQWPLLQQSSGTGHCGLDAAAAITISNASLLSPLR